MRQENVMVYQINMMSYYAKLNIIMTINNLFVATFTKEMSKVFTVILILLSLGLNAQNERTHYIGQKNYLAFTWAGHFSETANYKPIKYRSQNKVFRYSPELYGKFQLRRFSDTKLYVGIRYMNRVIEYEPYFYTNQKSRIAHNWIALPVGYCIELGNKRVKHHLSATFVSGFLLNENVKLYSNNNIIAEGNKFLIRAKNKYTFDLQLEYELQISVNDKINIHTGLLFANSLTQVIHNEQFLTTARQMGFTVGLNYQFKKAWK
jgi:hypothetical protein